MQYVWLVFALGAAIAYGILRLLYRALMKRYDPYAFALLLNIGGSLFALPYALPHWQLPSQAVAWGLAALSTALWCIVMVLANYSYKHTPVSMREPIAQTELIWVFLLSALLLRETLTAGRLVGAACILIGMLLVTLHGRFVKASFSNHGVQLTLLTAVLTAAVSIVDKAAMRYFDPGVYNFLLYLMPALVLALFIGKRAVHVKTLFLHRWKTLIIVSALSANMYYAILRAYDLTDASLVYPLVHFGSFIVIIGGMLCFPEERTHVVRKSIAAALIIVGGALIAGASIFSL